MIRSTYILACAILLTLSGCSTARKVVSEPDGGSAPSAEVMGPAPLYGPLPAPQYGPQPEVRRAVVLVFGPGMARGYAHAGVIRALEQNSIKIGGIVAAEMGSLIGALYALDPNVNRLEWSMMKFDREVFANHGLMASVFPGASSRLDAELKKVFQARDLADAKLPIKLAIRIRGTSTPTTISRGAVATVLRASLAADGLFSPASWLDGTAVSAAESPESLIKEARDMKLGPVVLVDVTDPSAFMGERPDLVLVPDLRGLSEADFTKRTEIAFRGSKAVTDALPRLRQLMAQVVGH